MTTTATTPPAGMRFRDHRDVVWTGDDFVLYGIRYKTAAEMIANFPTRFTDDDHAPLMDLKTNPYEPLPPEPVERDATWRLISDLLGRVWHASRGLGLDRWNGTDDMVDTILRAVRSEAAAPLTADDHVAALVTMGWTQRLVTTHDSGLIAAQSTDEGTKRCHHPAWTVHTALIAPAEMRGVES